MTAGGTESTHVYHCSKAVFFNGSMPQEVKAIGALLAVSSDCHQIAENAASKGQMGEE
jgi:hypothetical protein